MATRIACDGGHGPTSSGLDDARARIQPIVEHPYDDVFAALDDAGVDFVVVGGFAVVAHGHARLTVDADLVIDLNPAATRRAIEALLFATPPVPWAVLLEDAMVMQLNGRDIRIASIEHLLAMKQAAGRLVDRDDITALRRLQDGGHA